MLIQHTPKRPDIQPLVQGHSGFVLTHTQAYARFIEVTDGPKYRTELQQALRDGLTALGLLGWEPKDGTLQAKDSLDKIGGWLRGPTSC